MCRQYCVCSWSALQVGTCQPSGLHLLVVSGYIVDTANLQQSPIAVSIAQIVTCSTCTYRVCVLHAAACIAASQLQVTAPMGAVSQLWKLLLQPGSILGHYCLFSGLLDKGPWFIVAEKGP